MRVIFGGFAQGQLAYALEVSGLTMASAADGAVCSLAEAAEKKMVYNLHLLIRRLMAQGDDPWVILQWPNGDKIFVTDEVGGGLVPMEAFERQWREECGRICTALVKEAQQVERVYCGLAVTLKGESNV